jgi:serine/threonine protein kinase
MPLAAGTKLDGYEILDLLGAGGMGEVYRARDPALKRDVAIKVLPTFVAKDPDRLRRFEQEAQTAAARNHPNHHNFHVMLFAPYLKLRLLPTSHRLREHINLTGGYIWQAAGRLRKGPHRPLHPFSASNETIQIP